MSPSGYQLENEQYIFVWKLGYVDTISNPSIYYPPSIGRIIKIQCLVKVVGYPWEQAKWLTNAAAS